MAKLTKKDFIAALKEMSIVEVKELVDGLKEEFGIDPAAVAAAPAAAVEEEASEVSVIITGDGGKKINVIKAVRKLTGIGLMDAKKAVESLPYKIKEDISREEAQPIADQLKEAGAVVEIK